MGLRCTDGSTLNNAASVEAEKRVSTCLVAIGMEMVGMMRLAPSLVVQATSMRPNWLGVVDRRKGLMVTTPCGDAYPARSAGATGGSTQSVAMIASAEPLARDS